MKRSERLAAVSMMAAGLAHEINNPVAILANRIECMETDAAESGNPQFQHDLAVLREHDHGEDEDAAFAVLASRSSTRFPPTPRARSKSRCCADSR